tara:strand:- start:4100 stop:4576 length:477 start_codon:yes stop_codon:yes gene_type:complete
MKNIFLKWTIIFLLSLVGLWFGFYFDLHTIIWLADQTKLSFIIMGLYGILSMIIGRKTWENSTKGTVFPLNTEWFMAESLMGIGMVGTIIGFLLMLNGAFIDVSFANITAVLAKVTLGMSSALYTTLTGLVFSLLLKLQLVNLEQKDDGEEDEKNETL